jgi:predicted PurR-regulated permease PerM
MKIHWDKQYIYWGATAFLVVAASMLFYYGIFRMSTIISTLNKILEMFMPIIYGGVIAYLLNPILKTYENRIVYPYLERKKVSVTQRMRKVIRYIGIFICLLVLILAVYGIISMILPEIINSIVRFINNYPKYERNITKWVESILNNNPDINSLVINMIDNFSEKAESYLSNNILPQLRDVLRQFSAGLFDVAIFLKNVLIGVIISVYILADKEMFKKKNKKIAYAVLPKKRAEQLFVYLRFTDKTFGGFLSGKLLDSLIIGILCYVGCNILKMPYTLLVSVFVGVTNIIPFFGPYLGAIPSALLILMVNPMKCLYFIIFILILQQFDGNILGPKIIGNSTGLSSFMVILAILIGGGLFGVFGMFIGVPVCAVIYSTCWQAIDRRLEKKGLPLDLDEYDHEKCEQE